MKHLIIGLSFLFSVVSFAGNNQKEQQNTAAKIVDITSDNYEQESSKGLVLVDFWAPWCPPCRAMAPILAEVATEMKGKVKIVKVNVDNNKALAQRYKIESIPTFILRKDGKTVERITGGVEKDVLLEAIGKHLKK